MTTERETPPTPQKDFQKPKLRNQPSYQDLKMEGIDYKANSKTLYEIKEYLEKKFEVVMVLSKKLVSWIHAVMKKFKTVENFKAYVEGTCYGAIKNAIGFIKHLLSFDKVN